MYCNKCGKKLEPNSKICNYCGNILDSQNENKSNASEREIKNQSKKTKSKFSNLKLFFLGSGLGLIVVVVMFAVLINNTSIEDYYISTDEKEVSKKNIEDENNKKGDYENSKSSSSKTSKKTNSKNKTEIETETQYTFEYDRDISEEIAKELIVEDSEKQKKKNSEEITEVENKFVNKYAITAANLLEMNPEFADGLTGVFKKIYKEYPEVKGYLTNITLWNSDDRATIAAYQPLFPFALADTYTSLPIIYKMRILLNARYFLREDRLEKVISKNEKAGWFPENCDQYSPVSHELGHYISFLALMKEYNIDSVLMATEDNYEVILNIVEDFSEGEFSLQIIKEAYENYQKDYQGDEDIDEWRGNISGYATAKNNEGEYIYDETIAEAFHDVYLNGEEADIASKYIVEVLKEKLRK